MKQVDFGYVDKNGLTIYFRLSILIKSTNMNTYERRIGSDLQSFICGDVKKNRNQMMKSIRKFILNLLNWIQDLEQQHPNSCLIVFSKRLDPIS